MTIYRNRKTEMLYAGLDVKDGQPRFLNLHDQQTYTIPMVDMEFVTDDHILSLLADPLTSMA